MLDPGRDAPARDALAAEARKQIEAGGTLKHENDWGLRKMAYEISHRTEADYRWFRFEAPTDIDRSKLAALRFAIGSKLLPFAFQIGFLRVGLRADRHVLTGGHRHGPRD